MEKQLNRLLDAYQENLLTLTELRRRTNQLRESLREVKTELAGAQAAAMEQGCLEQIGEQVTSFLKCLQNRRRQLTLDDKQQIVRLLVKEIIIGENTVTVHHSIPVPEKKLNPSENCLLCTRRQRTTLRHSFELFLETSVGQDCSGFEILENESQKRGISNALPQLCQELLVVDGVKRLKVYRAVATRYEKLASRLMGFVTLAAICDCLELKGLAREEFKMSQ